MFNDVNNPTDFIVAVKTPKGNCLNLLLKGMVNDEHLAQEIQKVRSEFNFIVLVTYPVLTFNMMKPEGKGFWK